MMPSIKTLARPLMLLADVFAEENKGSLDNQSFSAQGDIAFNKSAPTMVSAGLLSK